MGNPGLSIRSSKTDTKLIFRPHFLIWTTNWQRRPYLATATVAESLNLTAIYIYLAVNIWTCGLIRRGYGAYDCPFNGLVLALYAEETPGHHTSMFKCSALTYWPSEISQSIILLSIGHLLFRPCFLCSMYLDFNRCTCFLETFAIVDMSIGCM